MKRNISEDEQKNLDLDEIIEATTISVEADTDERDKAFRQFKLNGHHSWVQRGIEISCNMCPNHHGFYVEPNILLKGMEDDGTPILDKIG